MGRTKGDLVLDGKPLAERAARVLKAMCGGVVVSVAAGMQNPAPSFPVVEDPPPAGRGPLAGIAAAFAASGKADLFVLACDYSRVGTLFLSRLAERADPRHAVTFPVDAKGRDHPLVGIWRRSAESVILEALSGFHYRVQATLAELDAQRLPAGEFTGFDLEDVLRNLNWPEDVTAP